MIEFSMDLSTSLEYKCFDNDCVTNYGWWLTCKERRIIITANT